VNPTPVTPTGILLIDKAPKWTSMDVCAKIRVLVRRGGAPKRAKVGHAGTLDPFATGLLVVMVGKATKHCNDLMASRKEYLATIDLSRVSDTQDPEGNITLATISREPSEPEVRAAIRNLTGEIMQTPPPFSAIHVGGIRAYELARRGEETKLAARPVTVHEFEILRYAFPLIDVRITCGKGTYIRSLARDLGAALGVGGMLTSLQRTAVGEFRIEHARTMDSFGPTITLADLLPLPEHLLHQAAEDAGELEHDERDSAGPDPTSDPTSGASDDPG